jgi:hypothetical protein
MRERVVDCGVAVRVVLAHHVADDRRALSVLGVGAQMEVVLHRVQDAALHRLQTIAHVGQRARGDDAERVVEIATLRLFGQRGLHHRRRRRRTSGSGVVGRLAGTAGE